MSCVRPHRSSKAECLDGGPFTALTRSLPLTKYKPGLMTFRGCVGHPYHPQPPLPAFLPSKLSLWWKGCQTLLSPWASDTWVTPLGGTALGQELAGPGGPLTWAFGKPTLRQHSPAFPQQSQSLGTCPGDFTPKSGPNRVDYKVEVGQKWGLCCS